MNRALPALAMTGAGVAIILNFHSAGANPKAAGIGHSSSAGKAKVGSATTTTTPSTDVTTAPVGDTSPGAAVTTAGPAATTAAPATAGGGATRTFDGKTINMRFGPVQVEIVMQNGKITDISALQLPSDRRRSQNISDYAAPILHDEAISAQSANIDLISGATYTSDAYAQSLQSALDAAHAKK
jgi:uncharacterized protein with FMN-binding domain